MSVRKVKESQKGLEANLAVAAFRLVAPILETSLSYYVFMFNNFYPASAWWIRASDGAMEPVTKHDLWLKNPKNLKKWGLEALNPYIERLTANEENAIRMIGIQAGLIRVRNYTLQGRYSI